MELDHQVGRLGWGPARSPGPWGWVSCLGLPLPNLVQLECLQWLHSLLPSSLSDHRPASAAHLSRSCHCQDTEPNSRLPCLTPQSLGSTCLAPSESQGSACDAGVSEVAQSCPTLLRPHGLEPTRLLCPWDFPGKSTGVGCHFLLQGIFPNQVSRIAGRFFTI